MKKLLTDALALTLALICILSLLCSCQTDKPDDPPKIDEPTDNTDNNEENGGDITVDIPPIHAGANSTFEEEGITQVDNSEADYNCFADKTLTGALEGRYATRKEDGTINALRDNDTNVHYLYIGNWDVTYRFEKTPVYDSAVTVVGDYCWIFEKTAHGYNCEIKLTRILRGSTDVLVSTFKPIYQNLYFGPIVAHGTQFLDENTGYMYLFHNGFAEIQYDPSGKSLSTYSGKGDEEETVYDTSWTIFKTADGGRTWELLCKNIVNINEDLNSDKTIYPRPVYASFIDENIGLISFTDHIGYFFEDNTFITTDGGKSWNSISYADEADPDKPYYGQYVTGWEYKDGKYTVSAKIDIWSEISVKYESEDLVNWEYVGDALPFEDASVIKVDSVPEDTEFFDISGEMKNLSISYDEQNVFLSSDQRYIKIASWDAIYKVDMPISTISVKGDVCRIFVERGTEVYIKTFYRDSDETIVDCFDLSSRDGNIICGEDDRYGAHFIDDNIGYFFLCKATANHGGTWNLYKTTDGGRTWSPVCLNMSHHGGGASLGRDHPCFAQMISEDVGFFAYRYGSALYVTRDAGKTWTGYGYYFDNLELYDNAAKAEFDGEKYIVYFESLNGENLFKIVSTNLENWEIVK